VLNNGGQTVRQTARNLNASTTYFNCNWGTCIVPPIRRPRAHHRVNPYLGGHRENETEMISYHDETILSIAAVSAPSVACSFQLQMDPNNSDNLHFHSPQPDINETTDMGHERPVHYELCQFTPQLSPVLILPNLEEWPDWVKLGGWLNKYQHRTNITETCEWYLSGLNNSGSSQVSGKWWLVVGETHTWCPTGIV